MRSGMMHTPLQTPVGLASVTHGCWVLDRCRQAAGESNVGRGALEAGPQRLTSSIGVVGCRRTANRQSVPQSCQRVNLATAMIPVL